jgi:3-oxoacyl-[acyl-carrier protein] reductase
MMKTALVTESSRVLGSPIARRLADDGFAVVLNSAGSSHSAEATVAEIAKSGGRAIAIHADVAVADDVERLFESTVKEFGRIDVVVSDAGILVLSPISSGDVGLLDETIRINLRGAYLVLSQAATHISEGGRIIAFSSNVLSKNLLSFGPYNASKAGVEALVRVLANELRPRQVTVNAIAPEHEDEELYLEGKSEGEIAQLRKLAPPVSPVELNDVVHLVSFLAGPSGGWVTGQVIPVKGGLDLIGSSSGNVRDQPNYSAAA